MSDAVRELRALARKGDTKAMIQLSDLYYHGAEGLDPSRMKSFEWLLKAAELGDAAAQNAVGIRFESGDGVSKDVYKGLDWYLKAFAAGSADACFNLGLMYELGDHVPQMEAHAVAFYEEGAQRGSAACQQSLAFKYLHGSGVRADPVRAMELFELAGQGGRGGAFETLGTLYLAGNIVPRNPEMAYDYFLRALTFFDTDLSVSSGDAPLLLALCMLTGTGCKIDRRTGTEVLKRAAEAGNLVAEEALRDRVVRDPLIHIWFSGAESFARNRKAEWDITNLLISKFA
ncbi:MAG TPA: tetratricopeptide repeat protein [Patescibacteria group bacterium]|nr:tetratricopeptide repeat protein [Patescibacteria group bacterium]